jgi:hypothetical protein
VAPAGSLRTDEHDLFMVNIFACFPELNGF